MTVTVTGLPAALHGLGEVLESYGRPGSTNGHWRWQVRQRLGALRDALVAESGGDADGWTAAREGQALRRRNTLLGRVSAMGHQAIEQPDVATVREELHRLLVDLGHHAQRLSDLAYDEVELELGGSE